MEKYPFATTPPHEAEASGWYNAAQAELQKAFIAGAKWQKEQMMKEAVEWLKETGANNLYISMFQREMEDKK